MRGSTIDQVRHDIDHAHTDMKVSEQIDEAEKAAGLQSMHPPKPDEEFGPWPVVCRGCRHFRRDHCRGGRAHLRRDTASPSNRQTNTLTAASAKPPDSEGPVLRFNRASRPTP